MHEKIQFINPANSKDVYAVYGTFVEVSNANRESLVNPSGIDTDNITFTIEQVERLIAGKMVLVSTC